MFAWYKAGGAGNEFARTVAVNTLIIGESVGVADALYISSPDAVCFRNGFDWCGGVTPDFRRGSGHFPCGRGGKSLSRQNNMIFRTVRFIAFW
ncbi:MULTISPECIES: hypothetical protein [Acetomicrobium]|nr:MULTISPECIES: hypothetical protein [Acetomicrobium]